MTEQTFPDKGWFIPSYGVKAHYFLGEFLTSACQKWQYQNDHGRLSKGPADHCSICTRWTAKHREGIA